MIQAVDRPDIHQPIHPAQHDQPIIAIRDLMVRYPGDEAALEGVSLDIMAGERLAVIGPNGAGKSTLIKALMGLLPAERGSITLLPEAGHPGYVAQHESVSWDFPVTVEDVVMMGLARHIGWLRWPKRAHWDQVRDALRRVDLLAFARRPIHDLSGGQRRRVFIARALAQNARVLILDEPFSGVDVRTQAELMDTLDRLNGEGMTIVLSTHDLDLAFHRFDRVLALRRHVIALGPAQTTYTPQVVAQLFGRKIIAWQDGHPVHVFVDDHQCDSC